MTYIPPSLPEDEDSIFSHYKMGINFDKYDDILVDVSGTNLPAAIMVRTGLWERLYQGLEAERVNV